ncbi:hypothetical protein SSX86_021233 [Deinandra increscens subsp. villosa]|uniref:Uncharacterized protein n=1 Tax=Deinandra increscens subsp. villosa TaxID=3103831 RepID=A0AAP0CPH8_9ASTR
MLLRQCLSFDRRKRPTAECVLQQLEKSLEFQEDYEIWGPKLPEDYEQILKLSTSPGISSVEKKKDLYNVFSNGVLLQDDKVCFSLGSNGERNEMISATTFSYRNSSPHNELCTLSESRFEKVAEMLDISNLMIETETVPQFLSPNTVYGVYLVFKFCDSRNVSKNPMYVDLEYKMVGNKTLHAYFAKWRDDEWMTIELCRFFKQKQAVMFKGLLKSLSPYYYRDHDSIYVQGIEFRAIDNVGADEIAKLKEIQQSRRSMPNVKEGLRLLKRKFWLSNKFSLNHEQFSLSEVNGNKHLLILAKPALYKFSDFGKAGSRFQEVLKLVPPQILRVYCTIKSEMLSPDTEYECYLVFKISIRCHGLHSPVEVRDLLQKNKVAEIVYFRSPKPWNVHDITRLSKQRKDGWMEVKIWNFNSSHELKDDCVLVNLKLISYEGSMSSLNVWGLEFRSI